MTEGEAPAMLSPELSSWLAGWEKCTQGVLSQTTGQTVVFDVAAEALPGLDTDSWFTVVVGGAIRGEMSLRLPAVTVVRLAQKFLQEVDPLPETPTAEHKEALEELLRQIAGQAATALAPVAGGQIQFHLTASTAPSWSTSGSKVLHTRDEAGGSIDIELHVSAALAAALPAHVEAAAPETIAAAVAAAESSTTPAAAARYERLRDVMLEVKLRFGGRRMLLRDVLALSAGVVVELDSQVSAPVDLLLDGRVVAHGHVVVVEGKYGLRVTEVVDARASV
jgi:flagellar motor switch protein FliN/FliY